MANLTGKNPTAIALHQFGSVEFLRSDAYCNLNDIAKPFGKRVNNWMRLKSTQSLFEAFRQDPSYNGAKPFYDRDLRSESTGKFVPGGGTFAHPDIAIQFAQWCSPAFALWVSRQIRHLLTYGEVNIHYREWSEEQYQRGVEFNREDIRELYK
ncbi:KilA-N domain-containing protein [Microcoleus sp. herbarium7]|uniref:KilA-N domain-containing protein n=1 Tax=Microcoleus sp. herbarium7 TaxID=3055435 RepID=UPI002FD470E7